MTLCTAAAWGRVCEWNTTYAYVCCSGRPPPSSNLGRHGLWLHKRSSGIQVPRLCARGVQPRAPGQSLPMNPKACCSQR